MSTFEDAFNLLCGKQLGEGMSRKVFECRIRPDLVVKVEDEEWRRFQNVAEQRFWDDNYYRKEIARWLAPCEYLSPDGRILLQRRAHPVGDYKLPDKLPSFLTDLKAENFGILDGRLVCVDYAFTVLTASMRLRKADWK